MKSDYLKVEGDELRDTTREINNLKSEMHEIKGLLTQLLNNHS